MDEQTVRDLNRRYHNTIISVTEISSGKSSVETISSIEMGDSGVAYVSFGAGDYKKLANYRFEDVPDSCVFDVDGVPFVYQVKPERQWRKGICNDNSHIHSPFTGMFEQFYGVYDVNYSINPYSKKAITNLFNPSIVSLQEGIRKLTEGQQLAVVTSKKNFISLSQEDDKFILWRMDRPLCLFNPVTKGASCFDRTYLQEVVDFFSRQGEHYNAF
jgi:hypothetical protein